MGFHSDETLGSLGQNYPKSVISPNGLAPSSRFLGDCNRFPVIFGFGGWGLASSFTTARHPPPLDDGASPPRAAPHLVFQFSLPEHNPSLVRGAGIAADLINAGCRLPQLRKLLPLRPPCPPTQANDLGNRPADAGRQRCKRVTCV